MKTVAFVFIFKYGTYPILYEYCNQLASLNYKVHYIGLSDTHESFVDSNGVEVIHLNKNKTSSPFGFSKSIYRELKNINPDIIHVFQFRWCLLLPLFSKFRWKWLLDVRTVHVGDKNGHYSSLTFLKNRLTWFESLFYNQSIALTKHVKSILYPSRGPVPVIPLGANSSKFRPHDREEIRHRIRTGFSLEPTDKVFLYSGTLNPNRKLDVVFTAFANLLKQHKQAFLFVLGQDKDNDMTLENYRALCVQLKISNRVHFSGHLPYHQMIQFYCASDIGISYVPRTPYFEYQPPTKLFEYMAAGIIPISTTSRATEEVLSDEHNGFLIQDDSESLMRAMAKAYNLQEEQRLTILAHARVTAEEYNWHHIIRRNIVPVYDRVLQEVM